MELQHMNSGGGGEGAGTILFIKSALYLSLVLISIKHTIYFTYVLNLLFIVFSPH